MVKKRCNSRMSLALYYIVILLVSTTLCTGIQQVSSEILQHPKLSIGKPQDGVSDNGASATYNYIDKAYIIRLSDSAADVNDTMAYLMNSTIQDGGNIGWVYTNVFNGISVTGMSNKRMTQILDNTVVTLATRVRNRLTLFVCLVCSSYILNKIDFCFYILYTYIYIYIRLCLSILLCIHRSLSIFA
jgi:hypothetical protein